MGPAVFPFFIFPLERSFLFSPEIGFLIFLEKGKSLSPPPLARDLESLDEKRLFEPFRTPFSDRNSPFPLIFEIDSQ